MTELERIEHIIYWLEPFAPRERLVVSGSGSMVLHGIDRPLGDLDLFTTTADWFGLQDYTGWDVITTDPLDPERRCDPPYLEREICDLTVNVFFGWRTRAAGVRWIDVGFWMRNAPVVRAGIRAIPLSEILRWKVQANRDKDLADLELIRKHVG